MIALSASKLTAYLQCPRRYWFRYVIRTPPAWKPAALALGSAVHAALETFHQQRAAGATMAAESVSALFRIDWASEQVEHLKFKDGETAEQLVLTGDRLVNMYAAANQNVEVVAAEVPFELPLIDDVMFRGVFDVLVQRDRVRELKTAARDYDEGTLSRHIQISAYAWAYREIYGRHAIVEVVALLKSRQPRIEVHEVSRSEGELEWFMRLATDVAFAIERGAFPPNPSWACSDCEFWEQCRSLRGRP